MEPSAKRTALITGASSGIGYELTHLCARNEQDLALITRSSDNLETSKKDFEQPYSIRLHTRTVLCG
ncbi:SDR family NAD(P)-dependent oxidoreductase [Spirosoma aureum]|uniref:SDR family NAD(P)-dependent oxidoreductase n=1 Tax=Spirosoma aureum TaxID=2692134 RepID=A0A6G9AMX6_9BACT|nr:SDR family NAD(P)-dependent oxidoreductase [Spirosoma aureum]QIP13674.1 SDR family NAD(P)-dependent oxidoreductase [Spirosoma aureum]